MLRLWCCWINKGIRDNSLELIITYRLYNEKYGVAMEVAALYFLVISEGTLKERGRC